MIKAILAELARPDSQGNDWYAWASNQLSHAFFGAVIALLFPIVAVFIALIVSASKELIDVWRLPTQSTIVDSLQDIAFWCLGAWLFSTEDYKVVALVLLNFALICGIIPRMKKK